MNIPASVIYTITELIELIIFVVNYIFLNKITDFSLFKTKSITSILCILNTLN